MRQALYTRVLEQTATTLGDQEALAVLKTYDYPGNVRELENIIERTVALEAGVPGVLIRIAGIEPPKIPPL